MHVANNARAFEAGIEGLTQQNEELLSARRLPPIYASGVVYRKERKDDWRSADKVDASGWGDCEDLASWRAAELRTSGIDPAAWVHVYRSGPARYHAVVGRGDGTVEDPSYILGMRVPRGWRPIQYVGETRFREGPEGIDMSRTMDAREDAYGDDSDEDGGFSDMQGDETEGPDFADGAGMDPDGDDAEGDMEGDETEGAFDPSFEATGIPGDDEGAGWVDPSFDMSGDDVEHDGDPNDPGGGASDYYGPGEGPEGDDGGAPSWGMDPEEGQEQGEDREADQADDPADQGPTDEAQAPAPPPTPKRRAGRARRIFRGAFKAARFAAKLSPSHQLAKRIPGVRRLTKYSPSHFIGRKLKLWGVEAPCCGIGPDPVPEAGAEATFDIYRSGAGWSGVIRLPTDDGRALMMATSPSATTAQAASRTVNMARLIPPEAMAMMPPQAKIALAALQHPIAKEGMKLAFKGAKAGFKKLFRR
jgi:hypothetical protein